MSVILDEMFEEAVYTVREREAVQIVGLLEFFEMLPLDESDDIISTIKDYYILRINSGNLHGYNKIKNVINMVKQNGYENSCIKKFVV